MEEPFRSTDERREVCLRYFLGEKRMSSVFSSLSFSLLRSIHALMSEMQDWVEAMRQWRSEIDPERYS